MYVVMVWVGGSGGFICWLSEVDQVVDWMWWASSWLYKVSLWLVDRVGMFFDLIGWVCVFDV